MPENLELERQLKLVAKTGSFVVGRREVASSLKGSKLLVWSASANVPQAILDESRTLSIPAIKFAGNPVELGRACGIPFRVSVIALKSTGDADLSAFTKATDYHSGVVVPALKLQTQEQQARQEPKSPKESEKDRKPKKESAAKKRKEGTKAETATRKKSKKAPTSDEGKKTKNKLPGEKETSAKKDSDEINQKKTASSSSSKKKSSKSKSDEDKKEDGEE